MVEMCEVFFSYLSLRPTLPLSKTVTCEWVSGSAVERLASEYDLKVATFTVTLPSAGDSRYNS